MEEAFKEYTAGNTNISDLARKHGVAAQTLTRRLKKAGLYKPTYLTLESAQERLKNKTDRFVVLDYVSGVNAKSRFFDKERDLEFEYQFGSLIHKLSADPTFIPRPSKEELSQRVSAGLSNGQTANKYTIECNSKATQAMIMACSKCGTVGRQNGTTPMNKREYSNDR